MSTATVLLFVFTLLNILLLPFFQIESLTNSYPFFTAESDSEDTSEPAVSFSKEDTDEMLRSDTEVMDCEDKNDDNSSAASDSFHSSTSLPDIHGRSGILKVSGAYKSIQAARRAGMSARLLANNSVFPLAPLGNLLSPVDLRSNNCFHVNSYEKKRNIMASFDTGSLQCTTCTMKHGHQLLEKASSRSSHSYKSPAVFILADQSFPAALPTGGDDACLHILRLEDASLADLTDILLDTLKPFCVPASTVVLLHSLSHLAWVGPAAYTEDLVRARQRMCGTYRSGILVLHGLPLPPCGCADTSTVNDLLAVVDWLALARDHTERDISVTRHLWRSRLFSYSSPLTNPGVQPPATSSSNVPPRAVHLRRSPWV